MIAVGNTQTHTQNSICSTYEFISNIKDTDTKNGICSMYDFITNINDTYFQLTLPCLLRS